jgi:hypothetical protein
MFIYISVYGSTTIMVSILKEAVHDVVRDALLEENKARLTYTKLYKEVIQKLASITSNNKISYRDFGLVLQTMVDENKLSKEDSSKRGSKVYYSLTENAKKEYQYNVLGIDKKKKKLRKLYELLFFYEIGNFGRISLSEKQLDEFLLQMSLSIKDFVAEDTKINGDDSITHFKLIKGIKILKIEFHDGGSSSSSTTAGGDMKYTSYSVTPPGFSKKEIMSKQERNNKSYLPELFEHVQFSEDELEEAFTYLRKADLIRPFQQIKGTGEVRFAIANEELLKLISEIHGIYRDKYDLLFVKSSFVEIDEKECLWLTNMFGEERTKHILKEWKIKHRISKDSKDKERMQKLAEHLMKSIQKRVEALDKKYEKVLGEYDFPLHIVRQII